MFIRTIDKDLINPVHVVKILSKYEVKKAIDDSSYIIFSDFYKVDNFVAQEGEIYCLCVLTDASKHLCTLGEISAHEYFELRCNTNRR